MVKLKPDQQAKRVDARPEVCAAFGGRPIDDKDALAIAWTNVAKIVQLGVLAAMRHSCPAFCVFNRVTKDPYRVRAA